MDHVHPLKEYKRNLVIRLFEKGESDETIAELTELSVSWIGQLRTIYNKQGSEALRLQKPGGSFCRLTPSNFESLRAILDEGAQAYGLEGEFWDRKRVKYVIKQAFNIDYDVEHISAILAKINYTLQKPRKKDFRQDDAKVALWTTEILPDIKKKWRKTQKMYF
jgi:transposase